MKSDYTNPIVTITGTLEGFNFKLDLENDPTFNSADKIGEILLWGNLRFGNSKNSTVGVFQNCLNLNLNKVSDIINLENLESKSMEGFFDGCLSLENIYNVNLWDVSNITNMNSMFNNCPNLNIDISSWNVSNVSNFTNFMGGETLKKFNTTNYDNLLNSWYKLPYLQESVIIDFINIYRTVASSYAYEVLAGVYGWTINDGGII